MKVLYFHQHFSTPDGATGNRSYKFSQHLIAAGHRVTMVCGSYRHGVTGLSGPFHSGMRRGSVDGIDVVEFQIPYGNSDSFYRRTRAFLSFAGRCSWLAMRENFDVVFATTTPLTASLPGILARWLRAKPFVFEVRDLWPELPKAMGVIKNPFVLSLLSMLEYVSYHSAQRLIGLSPGIVAGIVRRGVPESCVSLIPNGCDLDIFRPNADSWRPAGIGAGDFLAVFTGAHGIANGLDAVIDTAIELQQRRRSEIKMLLVGDGMKKKHLQARAAAHGLTNVVFHDAVHKAQLAALLRGADLGLQLLANVPAFYYGTSPNKFFDYIAAGLPVLTNYPGWIADLVEKHDIGFVAPADDPKQFADKLEAAARDRPALRTKGVRAKELARMEFHRDKLAADFVACLERVRRQPS